MTTKHTRGWAWVIVALFACATLGLAVLGGDAESADDRTQRLARSFACPECAGESVAASNSSTSRRIREIIQGGVADGRSDELITAEILDTYPGRDLRLAPPNEGIGRLLWMVPAGGVLLGAVAIWFALRRWSTTPRLAATAADEELVSRIRASRRGEQ